MQTILGSSGIIGTELAKALTKYTDKIRLVSRKPKRVNPTDQLVVADLTNAQQVLSAVNGSQVVYLTVGLQYKISVWQKQWPVIMQNVIDACKTHKAKLVFFDNVYAYGLVNGWMREDTRINPTSKGNKAQWFIDANKKHSMTYTPDAGKATALLGNTNSAYNQIWHLPTDKNVLTGKEFIEIAAKAFSAKPNYTVLKMWMIKMVGLFIPIVKESIEMLYQNEYDYLFDSTKFEKAFNFVPISYKDGIAETVKSMK
ncbi:MAG: NAD(P)H-binding protein [Ignavibacteriales bacterium]|nr:NAD(P)H-binding protein [Ignavibacteriales bacterium]